jgi:hypothetical protein
MKLLLLKVKFKKFDLWQNLERLRLIFVDSGGSILSFAERTDGKFPYELGSELWWPGSVVVETRLPDDVTIYTSLAEVKCEHI